MHIIEGMEWSWVDDHGIHGLTGHSSVSMQVMDRLGLAR
jgi:hypothetical protein